MGNRLLAIAVIVLLILDVITGIAATHSPSGASQSFTQLGVWKNMPSAVTELMGNTSYRGITTLVTTGTGESGVNVALSTNCILPSNTAGALLQLQYANYSIITLSNSSNFASLANGFVYLDNAAHAGISYPCPGSLVSAYTLLPAISANQALLFRVVGSGGGGIGDNPRFSFVGVTIAQQLMRSYTTQVAGITAAHFLWKGFATLPVGSTFTLNIDWLATNETSVGCSVVTSSCLQSGTSSCTMNINTQACTATTTVTFANAFTGTPNVVTQVTGVAPAAVLVSIGSVTLLSAQTLTV